MKPMMSETENTDNPKNSTNASDGFVKTHQNDKHDDYGFYFFPKRSPGKVAEEDGTVWGTFASTITKGRHAKDHLKCKVFVRDCERKHNPVKLLMRAMKSHGCPVDLTRHVQCEPCRLKVSGGFDHTTNQVVICENNVRNEKMCCNVLAHELLHAFDKCRTKMDFRNPEHVACTEIRAANLFHCSMVSAMATGEATPWDIKMRHMDCVKKKAALSLLLVRNISDDEAEKTVDRVFKRCYNDLEPFGRRLRRGTDDCNRALLDGVMYGYSDP